MKFLRPVILGTLVSLSLFISTAAVPTVRGCPVFEGPHHGVEGEHRRYHVYYRPGPHSPWISYGRYHSLHHAEEAQRRLHHHGYEAFIR